MCTLTEVFVFSAHPVNCGLGGRLTGVGIVSDGVGGRGGNDLFIAALQR